MTTEEIDAFKIQFKRIVYKKGLIKVKASFISSLHVWDKGGSHTDAINKHVSELRILKEDYKNSLQGSTYDEWLKMSRTISKIQSSIKSAATIKTKEKNETMLLNLKF